MELVLIRLEFLALLEEQVAELRGCLHADLDLVVEGEEVVRLEVEEVVELVVHLLVVVAVGEEELQMMAKEVAEEVVDLPILALVEAVVVEVQL